jgi:large subunit ribosomal protein L5
MTMAKGKGQKKGAGKKAKKAKFQNEPIKREKAPALHRLYKETIIGKMVDEFKFENVMMVPKVTKVILNVGLGDAIKNPKLLESVVREFQVITGRKAVITKARKSIVNFKLREGMKIGTKVTLRREVMYEFLERLISIALPRTRDFKGVSAKGFDGRGNYSIGVKEQIVFPEINYDDIEAIRGLNITIVTSARNDVEAKSLLGYLGMPFRK